MDPIFFHSYTTRHLQLAIPWCQDDVVDTAGVEFIAKETAVRSSPPVMVNGEVIEGNISSSGSGRGSTTKTSDPASKRETPE